MISDKEFFISLVDNDLIKKSDAIILLEGDGLNRSDKAVELYKNKFANLIVFSGGIKDYKYGSYPFEDVRPYLIKNKIPIRSLLHESKSKNTKEQAVNIIELAIEKKWNKLILVASQEHQYRAYLTFLKEILNKKCKIILYNSPKRNLKWFDETGWGNRFDKIKDEFRKINHYSKIGHLASYAEAIKYQKWKEKFQ
jgi:uncharacterized SAM-binding protein YcdF (DUF218 family)